MPSFIFGVRRQDGAFSGPACWSALWVARRVAPLESGDTSPHSKSLFLGHEREPDDPCFLNYGFISKWRMEVGNESYSLTIDQ